MNPMATMLTMPTGTTTSSRYDVIWGLWNTTATTGDGLLDPWSVWNCTAASITAVTSGSDPWTTWNISLTERQQIVRITMDNGRTVPRQQENPEIAAARQRQWEADRAVALVRQRQRAEVRKAAEERAEKLLVSILSETQRAQFAAERRFTVHLPNGNRYIVKQGRHGNIVRVNENGMEVEQLCVHVAPPEVPDCDNMAAQKLMLEHSEPELRAIANIMQYGRNV